MEISKEKNFKKLNRILTKEIFLLLPIRMVIMNLMVINKKFYKLITEEKWFKILKNQNFDEILCDSKFNVSKIKQMQNIFTGIGES